MPVIRIKSDMYRAGYAYNKGWSSMANHGSGLTEKNYCGIAKATVPELQSKAEKFLTDNGLSFITIPFDLYQSYEQDHNLHFEELFKQICDKNRKNPAKIDVIIIEANPKAIASAQRKGRYMEANKILDYLRTTYVTTNNRKINGQSMLNYLIQRIENNDETLARKNYYHTPHKSTEFRAFKTLWLCGKKTKFGGLLAEVQIKDIRQMNLDKLTRSFMHLERASKRCANGFLQASAKKILPNVIKKQARAQAKSDKISKTAKECGKILYRKLFSDTGIDSLLEKKQPAINVDSYENIYNKLMEKISIFYSTKHASQKIRDRINQSGVFPEHVVKAYKTPKQWQAVHLPKPRLNNTNRVIGSRSI